MAVFGAHTRDAVLSFQTARGLHASGLCDEQTWLALVEAGWHLGDRLLHLTAPHLRGDDVGHLQTALNQLGFDCGRPDGILGQLTARALEDFQRNSGLTVDGVCGPHTVRMVELVGRQTGSGRGVAWIRESEAMTHHTALENLRIVVGQFGGLSSIGRGVARSLRAHGATVVSTDEYEASAQAAAANRFGATAYVGFEARPDTCADIAYFGVPTFESVGGRSLGGLIARHLEPLLAATPRLRGMRLPVLRETRMPAVLCALGPVRDVVDESAGIADAVVSAVTAWTVSPLHVPDP